MNYFATVYADVEQVVDKLNYLTGEKTTKIVSQSENNPIAIASIPVMVKSKYCLHQLRKIYMVNVNMTLEDIL